MPAEIMVTRDDLAEDSVFILQCVRQNALGGRSTHMADVRQELGNSITLEFSDYLKFLRTQGYLTLDREQHTLSLTAQGEKASQSRPSPQLLGQLDQFFADKLAKGVIEVASPDEEDANLDAFATATSAARPMPPPPVTATPFSDLASVGAGATHRPPPPPPSVEEGGVYLRGAEIGRGPFGTVSHTSHSALGISFAFKEFSELSDTRLFGTPAQSAARIKDLLASQAKLAHPAVVQVHDLDVLADPPVAILELCGGGNLRNRLTALEGKGMPAAHVLQAFGQLLGGLAHAHAHGVTHHNLKAENVLFDVYGNAKLADFGLGRLLQVELSTGKGIVLDPAYVSYRAPELLAGAPASPSADVYALGILFYEALTGQVPGRRSPLPSAAVPGVPPAIDDIFDRMTADRATDRYPDARAALDDLHKAFPDGRFGLHDRAWVQTAPWREQLAPSAPVARPAPAARPVAPPPPPSAELATPAPAPAAEEPPAKSPGGRSRKR